MSFSHSAANNVVPLLARIVLGAAFISVGWGKVFDSRPYSGEELRKLQEMDVLPGAPSVEPGDGEAEDGETVSLHFAAYTPPVLTGGRQGEDVDENEQDDEALGEEQEESGGDEDIAEDEPPADAQPPDTAEQEDAAGPSVNAKKLYGVATVLYDTPLQPYAGILAWVSALTELVGGGLILLGLFSRIAGLGLAINMAVAFWLTTLPVLVDNNFNLFLIANPEFDGGVTFNHLFVQAGLFVLAFGILLTGPGAASIDRVFFKSGHDHENHDLT